jgi:hypothetical protein
MAAHNWVEILIDWMALPSLALLAGILLYRKCQREFPFFFSYIVVTDAIGIARLLASQIGGKVYYYVYWGSDIAVAVFAFLATYELFIKRLFPSFYKTGFYRYLFPAATVLITLVAASTAFYGGKLAILVVGVRVYEFLRAAILLFFLALMVFMGRRWSKQEFGIAFGFGLDVSAAFAALAMLSSNPRGNEFVNRIAVFAYDIACIIWLYCFWTAPKAQPVVPAAHLSAEALQEAKKWEDSLKDFMSHGKR